MVDFLNSNFLRVAVYVAAAVCCLLAARAARSPAPLRSARFWIGMAVILLVLGLGREIRLGNWIADEGRTYARDHGWYPERRPLQRAANYAIFVAGACALVATAVIWRAYWRSHLLPACLLIVLATFVAIRTVSYHYVDQALYNHPFHGVRANSAIELGLTSAIALTALVSASSLRAANARRVRVSPP